VKDQLRVVYVCVCVIIPGSVCRMLYVQLSVRVLRAVKSCFETGRKCGLMFLLLNILLDQ